MSAGLNHVTDRTEQLLFIKEQIRDIPNFPKPGILFRDITPVWADRKAFSLALDLFERDSRSLGATKVVGIESRGFIFGAPLALRLGVGFVPVRKPGKLPHHKISESYDLEYGSDSVEMHLDAIGAGDRVIICDDLIATGGTMLATCKLVEKAGAEVVGILALVELAFLPWRKKLEGYKVTTYISYDSE